MLARPYFSMLSAIVCFAALWQPILVDAADFPENAKPFLVNYCNDCHADGADEGGFELKKLGKDLSDPAVFAKWERVFDRVRSREMPPNDAGRVEDGDHASFVKLVGSPLFQAHRSTKGTVLRRLNRREYQNTMNDIFGTEVDLESQLPEDGRSGEFDNVGESLSVSLVQLERYMKAADQVLNASIAATTERPQEKSKKANYADSREGKQHIGKAWGQADDGAVVFFRPLGYPTGMLRDANAATTGRYKIRVTGYAYRSDKPITFAVGATTFQRGQERPTFGYFSFPPDKPTTIELEALIKQRYMIEITPWGISDRDNEIRKNGIDAYKGPGLAIKEVELIGPLTGEFPSPGHKLLFDGLDRSEIEPSNPSQKTKKWYVPKFQVASENTNEQVPKVLERIANRAFRRPASKGQVQPFVDLYKSQIGEGASVEEALRASVVAIFCSPDFLYLTESDGWLDDYQIAARLSYFLNRTTPDEALLLAAQKGQLSTQPEVLRGHAKRLMGKPEFERFVVDFTDAWLNLRDIDFTSPDRNLFPEFDQFLQYSMLEETRRYFRALVEENLSVRNLVASDFAVLNNRLAKHYEIDGVEGPGFRQVSLPSKSVRGGLLGQASILKVSANGTNTSPVVRGVWVTERILGIAPQPPPPGIPGVEPDIRGSSTLRELLDKHRDVDSCRSCHNLIDPPGFALESFNPIGGWRDKFRSLGDGERVNVEINGRKVRYKVGQPVDSSGRLRNGQEFSGFVAFRELLASNDDRLAKTLITKMLIFATGREMGFSDRQSISKLVAQSKSSGHGVRDLMELVVLSEMFRQK